MSGHGETLLAAFEAFQSNPAVRAQLRDQLLFVETLFQRAEGSIPGWTLEQRLCEGLAAVRENGKAILMGLDEETAVANEIRGMRALDRLYWEVAQQKPTSWT